MKSAVNSLIESVLPFIDRTKVSDMMLQDIVEHHVAMEQDQIIAAYQQAEKDCGKDFLHGDLYYDETFKSE